MNIPLLPYDTKAILVTYIDFEGADYKVYEEKIPYIKLFRGELKFHSRQKLRVISVSLMFLNPSISLERLKYFIDIIVENHFIHGFTDNSKSEIAEWAFELYHSGGAYNPGRRRRLVFNPNSTLSLKEKQAIVGTLSSRGRKYDEEKIYLAVEELMDVEALITLKILSQKLSCSVRTLSRNLSDDIKGVIDEHNKNYRWNRDLDKIFNATEELVLKDIEGNRANLKKVTKLRNERVAEICDFYNIL